MTAVPLLARRAAALLAAAVLVVGPLAACSGEGSDVDCSLNACTVTFDRGVDAEASILGIDVKLVGVDGGNVTLDVNGNSVSVPVDGEVQSEGLDIDVQEVTDDKVVLKVTKT